MDLHQSASVGATLYQKVEIFDILGAAFPPLRRLRWNFAQPSGPRCPSALPSLTWIGATSPPCGAKKPDFWPVSKFNNGSLPLRGNPAGNKTKKHHIFAPTAGAHCAIFPKLYTVIELVVPIIKVSFILGFNTVFPKGCTEKFGLIYRRAVSQQ